MIDEDLAWYRQLLEADLDLLDMACWTVIQPLTGSLTVAEVVRRLGGDPAEIEQRTGWEPDEMSLVHLTQVGTAVVILETDGTEGTRDEVLRRLSDGAMVHSSWWVDAIGRGELCYAAFGRLLTRMQYIDANEPEGAQPTALDEDRAALRGFNGDLEYPAQLALVERRTGVRLDPAWLDRPHATALLSKPIEADPRPPGMFAAVDPDLAAVFLLAGERTRRNALHWVLGMLAEEWDLRAEPLITAVLDALVDDWPSGEELSRRAYTLRMRLTEAMNASPGGSPERWQRYCRLRAGEAFAATVVDAGNRPGPSEALWYAQQALQERWPDIRAQLWRRARSS
jgi:Family of unknown function (DUF6461)